jgi:hypothetical protein
MYGRGLTTFYTYYNRYWRRYRPVPGRGAGRGGAGSRAGIVGSPDSGQPDTRLSTRTYSSHAAEDTMQETSGHPSTCVIVAQVALEGMSHGGVARPPTVAVPVGGSVRAAGPIGLWPTAWS